MSDASTQRIDATPSGEPAPDGGPPPRDHRTLLIVLIVIAAAVLIGLIVTVMLLLFGDRHPDALATESPVPATTSAAPTPAATSAAPSAAASPTPSAGGSHGDGGGTAQPTGGVFTLFQAPSTVRCAAPAPNFSPPPVRVTVSWQTIRTDSVWFVQGTSDAADSRYMQVPVSGTQQDFPYEVDFPCGAASATYNLTLVGSDGRHVQKVWTVTNTGDRY